jgi:hypothetical protein
MSDFLKRERIATEADAVIWSVNAAVQRNRVYESYAGRGAFRTEWMRIIREESQRYRYASQTILDAVHCETIGMIANHLSDAFAPLLKNRRLRYGTSQKAFNLYLKYLWHLGELPRNSKPPHCPIDRIVLSELDIYEAWTKSDSQQQYMGWITAISSRSESIPDWENEVFLRRVSR